MDERAKRPPRRPPRLPQVKSKEELEVGDLSAVLLAEFSDAPIKEMIDLEGPRNDNRKKRRAAAKAPPSPARPATIQGKRLLRVLHPTDGVLAAVDPQSNEIPLRFMDGRGAVVVLASVRPGDPYVWQLVGLRQRESDSAKSLTVAGAREATAEEGAALDLMYPMWRERCEEFDRAFAAGERQEAALPIRTPKAHMPPAPDERVRSRKGAARPHFRPGSVRPPPRAPRG